MTGFGVKLNMALLQYATDFLYNRDYQLHDTPTMMNLDVMTKVSQLSDFDESLYKVEGGKYLIATSEQPLTAMFHNKTINKSELPIMIGGISNCYRKETGAHGIKTLH